jgi:Hydrogenase maturation protease
VHFVLRLMEGFEAVIVVDAVSRGQLPGTLYALTPSAADLGVRGREHVICICRTGPCDASSEGTGFPARSGDGAGA